MIFIWDLKAKPQPEEKTSNKAVSEDPTLATHLR